jgi:hypothetical protein
VECIAIVVLLVIAAALWSLAHQSGYRGGKRDGSRKAYGVGFDRSRRSRSPAQGGCVLLFALLALLALVAAVLAR